MLIPIQMTACLWCGKRFPESGDDPAGDCVPRSDEHIIPESIGGKIKTRDVCCACNSHFGALCDHAMVDDQRIMRAAEEAGYKFTDFRKTFKGTQKTETGGEVPTRYKQGQFKPRPQLRPTSALMVPAGEWAKLRQQVRESLIVKVGRKHLPSMDEAAIALEVDQLMAAMDTDPSRPHYNERIGEGFRLTVSSGPVTGSIEMFPWETDWCLAKAVVELACLTWPREYQGYFREAIQYFRDFLSNREHDPAEKTGTGAFQYAELAGLAAKHHEIICKLSPTMLQLRLTFFGTAQWAWDATPTPVAAPLGNGWHIRVMNPLNGDDGVVECSPL